MARSRRSLSGSLAATPTLRSMLAPHPKKSGCHRQPRQRQTGSACNPALNHAQYDGTLARIHHVLYMECREQIGREVSPTACVIDSQNVKSAEKGGPHRSEWLRCRQEDQGKEATYPGRYGRIVAARDRSSGGHPGSRRWGVCHDHHVRPLSVPSEVVR